MRSTAVQTLMLALLILLPSFAGAQTHKATIRGTVKDPNGALVPGASVNIQNNETSETRSATSDAQGEYAIASLPAGNYMLTVQASGFDRFPQ